MTVSYMVDLGELDGSISDMATFDGRVQTHLDALDAVVTRLHGHWHGDAAAAQRDAHQKWTSGAEEMRTALGEMKAAATVAHENYTHAADANRRMWQQVR